MTLASFSHSIGSGIKDLQRGWTLLYAGVAKTLLIEAINNPTPALCLSPCLPTICWYDQLQPNGIKR